MTWLKNCGSVRTQFLVPINRYSIEGEGVRKLESSRYNTGGCTVWALPT